MNPRVTIGTELIKWSYMYTLQNLKALPKYSMQTRQITLNSVVINQKKLLQFDPIIKCDIKSHYDRIQ